MNNNTITTENLNLKNSNKNIDNIIERIKNNGGSLSISGDFNISFSYIDDPDIKNESIKGFSILILPKDRDGYGISIKFDPYDEKICSGIIEVIEESIQK